MVVIWVYIPPPPRPAFSPFLSQFLPETLFNSFKQSTLMYKQPSAAGTGWWTGEPSSLASSHSQQPFKLISKQFGLTTLHTMEVFKLAGFFTTADKKKEIVQSTLTVSVTAIRFCFFVIALVKLMWQYSGSQSNTNGKSNRFGT